MAAPNRTDQREQKVRGGGAYYICRHIRSLFLRLAPRAKNNDVVRHDPGVAAVASVRPASVSLVLLVRMYARYAAERVRVLKEIYMGREKRRGAGRPALRRGPSECVNIQATERKRGRERKEKRERDKLAFYIHGHPEFIRSRDSTCERDT